METTRNQLTQSQLEFFHSLRLYINQPIYFYGSIQRSDYFPGQSDIDIDIFTNNEESTKYALCNFLKLNKHAFRRSAYKNTEPGGKIIYGYKTKYEDPAKDIRIEISLYNENVKEFIMKDNLKKTDVPLHISTGLVIIKFLYYKLGWISDSTFRRSKGFLLNDSNENYILLP
jgi:hypothetical protein